MVLAGFRPEAAGQLDSETRTDSDLFNSLQLADQGICGGHRQQGRLTVSHFFCSDNMETSTQMFYNLVSSTLFWSLTGLLSAQNTAKMNATQFSPQVNNSVVHFPIPYS